MTITMSIPRGAAMTERERSEHAWVDEFGVDCRVRWADSSWISEWHVGDPGQWVQFGHPAAAAEIAKLKGLVPPGGEE